MSSVLPEITEETDSKDEEKLQPPSMYKVILHNDDYTTMEFVVEILMDVFNKEFEVATLIMLDVHNEGMGICGVYPYEIAETKVGVVRNLALEKEFPLKCTIEQE